MGTQLFHSPGDCELVSSCSGMKLLAVLSCWEERGCSHPPGPEGSGHVTICGKRKGLEVAYEAEPRAAFMGAYSLQEILFKWMDVEF